MLAVRAASLDGILPMDNNNCDDRFIRYYYLHLEAQRNPTHLYISWGIYELCRNLYFYWIYDCILLRLVIVCANDRMDFGVVPWCAFTRTPTLNPVVFIAISAYKCMCNASKSTKKNHTQLIGSSDISARL